MSQPSPHAIVLVFDKLADTAALRQVLVTHESLELYVSCKEGGKPAEKITPVVSKQLVADKLGRRAAVGNELLALLAERFVAGGNVVLTGDEVARLLESAAEERPQVVVSAGDKTESVIDYASSLSEAGFSEVVASDITVTDGVGPADFGGEITLAVVGGEEDAA